jgi:hypothetical protein
MHGNMNMDVAPSMKINYSVLPSFRSVSMEIRWDKKRRQTKCTDKNL